MASIDFREFLEVRDFTVVSEVLPEDTSGGVS